MKLIRVDDSINSYTIPIIKTIGFIVLSGIILVVRLHVHIEHFIVNHVVGIISAITIMFSFYCIIIAISEMLLLSDRREIYKMDYNKALARGTFFSFEYVYTLLIKNDIVDVLLLSDKKVIRLGASSKCRRNSSEFYNKHYYIDKQNDASLEVIKETIKNSSSDKGIFVIQIDGVPAKRWQPTSEKTSE